MKKFNFGLLLLQTLLMPLQLCLLIVLRAGKVPIAICAFLLALLLCMWAGSVLKFSKKGGIVWKRFRLEKEKRAWYKAMSLCVLFHFSVIVKNLLVFSPERIMNNLFGLICQAVAAVLSIAVLLYFMMFQRKENLNAAVYVQQYGKEGNLNHNLTT